MSEARDFQVLVEATPTVITVFGADRRYVYVNPAAVRVFRYESAEAMLGRDAFDNAAPDQRELLSQRMMRVMQGEILEPLENEMIRADGERFWGRTTSVAVTFAGVPAVAIIGQEITELKRTEEALRTSEARYRMLLEHAGHAVTLWTVDGTCLTANHWVFEGLGRPAEQVVGGHARELIGGAMAETMLERLGRAAGQREALVFDDTWGSPGGTRHWRSTYVRVVDDDGSLVGIQVSAEDATDRVQAAEEELRQQARLEASQRLEAVGQLAGGVAHDFNNLLTVINTYAELSLNQIHGSDPLREGLEAIKESGKRAAELTRQLLAFSRQQVLEIQVLDLNRVVEGVEKMLSRLIGEEVVVRVDLGERLGAVEADLGQLEQVLINLAVNARDAMPGGGELVVETANTTLSAEEADGLELAGPGRYVTLGLSDNGEGMDAETKARIFEPFFTTKDKGKGTGLGLATVYGIVKQSGGGIGVESTPGKGTTFTVYLPRADEKPSEPTRQVEAVDLGGSETVLVVEDEPAVRRIAVHALRGAGYKVLSAANAGEALLTCEREGEGIELMLTDVVMPQMNGKQLADRLAPLCPRLRVLFMSGYTDDAIVHHGVLDPGVELLSKPFTASELRRRVRQVLDED